MARRALALLALALCGAWASGYPVLHFSRAAATPKADAEVAAIWAETAFQDATTLLPTNNTSASCQAATAGGWDCKVWLGTVTVERHLP